MIDPFLAMKWSVMGGFLNENSSQKTGRKLRKHPKHAIVDTCIHFGKKEQIG